MRIEIFDEVEKSPVKLKLRKNEHGVFLDAVDSKGYVNTLLRFTKSANGKLVARSFNGFHYEDIEADIYGFFRIESENYDGKYSINKYDD